MTEKNDQFHEDDRRIDAVLHALAHAEPDATMQARLVASLRTAGVPDGAQAGAPRLRWAAPFTSGSLPLRLALAACLLAVAGACLHHTALQYGAQPDSRPAGIIASAVSQPGFDRPAVTAEAGRLAVLPQRGRPSTIAPKLKSAATRTLTNSLRRATVASGSDRTHSHAAGTASVPPPPLPLTEQERLLLRLGRQEPAEQLAMLALPARNAAFQREKDAVTEFFAPAPPLRSQAEPSPSSEPAGQP